jgi:thiol-disulfide isomerase/thioredoxin
MLKLKPLLSIVISLMLLTGIFLSRSAEVVTGSNSTLAGLATMKSMIGESVPWDVAIGNKNPIIIEFYADWCTTCQGMAPVVNEMHHKYGDKINLVMLNIDEPRWAQQVEEFGVTGVPQFTFLDAHHEVVKTLVGRVPEQVFDNVLAKL